MLRIIICIVIMALVTYLTRVITLVFFKKKIKNRFVNSVIYYLPYGVISAMIFPDIIYSTDHLVSGIVGAIVALIIGYFKKGLLLTAIGAIIAVLITEYIFFLVGF